MRKNVLFICMLIVIISILKAETVEYGFLTFEIQEDFEEADSLYPGGFALKKGLLDPNKNKIDEGLYINVSISTDIGTSYIPQWESGEAKKIVDKEIIKVDGLEAWQYTGYMTTDEKVWFTILYFPLSEIETEKEMLFITMANGDDETQSINLIGKILASVKVQRPERYDSIIRDEASLSQLDGVEGVYKRGQVISLSYTIDEKYLSSSPWICIVPTEIAHGSSDINDLYDITYAFLKTSQGEIKLWAPEQPGQYDFRINSSYFDGLELLSMPFKVE